MANPTQRPTLQTSPRTEPRLLFSEPFFSVLSLAYLDAAPAPWAVKVTLQFTM